MTTEPLLADSAEKLRSALSILFASADEYVPVDPTRSRATNPGSGSVISATGSSPTISRAS
jgi:hypothetical protein